jgi:hypothetical protein
MPQTITVILKVHTKTEIKFLNQSQSQSHITTDNQSWCQVPIWDMRLIFLSPWDFLQTVEGLLFCSVLSDERMGQ